MLTRRLFRVSLFALPVLLLAGAEPSKPDARARESARPSLARRASTAAAKKGGTLRLNLRTRVEPFKGSGAWEEVVLRKELPGKETAVILCDVWDRHWCESASRRCAALAKKMVPVLKSLRAKGVTVIHAPSECMEFYRDAPQRKRVLALPRVSPPRPLALPDPPLPVDDSDGGCDDEKPAKPYKAWTRQHPVIPVEEGDFISDDGREVYSLLRRRGIKNLLVMGVHTNMCVLNRSFAIKQMTRWGVRCVLVRDLTDAMYNPKRPPHVSHERGTGLVIEHIEKHWCPTVLSADLLK
jgi:nicotinamidase-related amidase